MRSTLNSPSNWPHPSGLPLTSTLEKTSVAASAPDLKGLESEVATKAAPVRDSTATERAEDCTLDTFSVASGSKQYTAAAARLAGEAGLAPSRAFFAVLAEKEAATGFSATLGLVKKDDLSMSSFPWIRVVLLFILFIGGGLGLMFFEVDRPLKKLSADAVALAKGEGERLKEDAHRGKYGSIARSVNIQLDKQQREAKAAKKDLDQLLGPPPADGIGTFDASGAQRLPAPVAMAPPATPPPPSEFKFTDAPPAGGAAPFELDLPPPPPAVAQPQPPVMPDVELPEPPTPAEQESQPPPEAPLAIGANATDNQVPPAPISLPGDAPPPLPEAAPGRQIDDDILGDATPPPPPARAASDFDEPTQIASPSQALLDASAQPEDESEQLRASFRQIFDNFIALKRKCGESTTSLTFSKFATKLERNRNALLQKHACKEVKFQVYIKDGKAALKATPVKS